jgi:hypothetical protein
MQHYVGLASISQTTGDLSPDVAVCSGFFVVLDAGGGGVI